MNLLKIWCHDSLKYEKSDVDKHVDNGYIYADKLIKEVDPLITTSIFEELTLYSPNFLVALFMNSMAIIVFQLL